MPRRHDALTRRVRHSALLRGIVARLGAGYIRLVMATGRWQVVGAEHRAAMVDAGQSFIGVFWHGRLCIAPALPPGGWRGVAMISANRDGDLITAVVDRFGIETVRGSSYDRAKGRDKGGAEAYQAALEALANGPTILGITPDGPRGPRMRAQKGAAMLALETGAEVVPIAFSARPARMFRSWDRFLLPMPFSRGVTVYGAPIKPGDEDADSLTARIEAALTEVTQEADRLAGRDLVEPAALPEAARGSASADGGPEAAQSPTGPDVAGAGQGADPDAAGAAHADRASDSAEDAGGAASEQNADTRREAAGVAAAPPGPESKRAGAAGSDDARDPDAQRGSAQGAARNPGQGPASSR